MNPSAAQSKALLRRRLREEAMCQGALARKTGSEAICVRLRAQCQWQQARCILFFAPMEDEPDVWPLLPEALERGRVAGLPRFCRRRGDYEARQVLDPSTQVKVGHFGIREPDSACPVIRWNSLDMVLVPGVGFSPDGYRLGRGRGYYDRLLARVPGVKCGVAFDWQITPDIPAEPHDIRLDCILTPTRWCQVVAPRRF